MIKIDDSDIKKLERQFKTFAARAYPFATKATVNTSAFNTQAVAKNDIRRKLILRNKFTGRSIRVKPTRTLRVSKQAAAVGSDADYMERQEFGGVVRRRGKRGKPIPTARAGGLPKGTQPITRLPKGDNKLQKIKLKKRTRGKGSRLRRNIIKIKQAAKSGSKYIYLDLGEREGIFKVVGRGKKKKIDMIHDLSSETVVTPRTPWLLPAVKKIQPQIPKTYKRALIFQAKRNKLFGY